MPDAYPAFVKIVDVGPRDGLQNEAKTISVADKIKYIHMLADAGLTYIEAGAFVSPKWVPQMADTEHVLAALDLKGPVTYSVLVPNMKGMESAIAAGVREVAVFAAASESFSQKNINCSIDESIERFLPVMAAAKEKNIRVRGYVSCVMGCPYEGDIAPEAVARVSKKLADIGCYEISLGDTIGTGTPLKTRKMLDEVLDVLPKEKLALHFHDTHHRAIENLDVGLSYGISVIDSSTGGIGGCPYAKGATGNVATEAVLQMLESRGIRTDIDLQKLMQPARFITEILKRTS